MASTCVNMSFFRCNAFFKVISKAALPYICSALQQEHHEGVVSGLQSYLQSVVSVHSQMRAVRQRSTWFQCPCHLNLEMELGFREIGRLKTLKN